MKKYYLVLLIVSVLFTGGCGNEDKISSENTGKEKDIHEESNDEEKELVTVHTGIETRRIWVNDAYLYFNELDDYLDRKQFAPLKLSFNEEASLFEGVEGREWSEEDWDLVRPLGNVSAYDCGYGKVDYNNDGTKEILYRNLTAENELEITEYEVYLETNQVVEQYNWLDFYQNEIWDKGCLRQIWFEEIEGEIITFGLYEECEENSFMIYSGKFTGNKESLDFSLIEARSLIVLTEEIEASDAASGMDIFTGVDDSISDETDRAYLITAGELNDYQEKERVIEDSMQETDLPEEFAEIVKKAVIADQGEDCDAEEVLNDYKDKKHRVEIEEVLKFLGDSLPDYFEESLVRCAYLADLDNDGKNELIMSVDSGGSAGYADVEVWKKNENNIAEEVDSFPEFRGYEALFSFDESYYFVVKEYDYYTRETEGFSILSFNFDGTIKQHGIMLKNKNNQKEWKERYCNENMDSETLKKLKEYVNSIRTEVENKTVGNDDYELIYGQQEIPYTEGGQDFSIEAFSKYQYVFSTINEGDCVLVDFDNDGEQECVMKSIWLPSSLNSVVYLNTVCLKKYDSYVQRISVPFPEGVANKNYHAGNLITVQLWFEEFDGKIYIFHMKRVDSTSDYIFEVSLIEDKKLYPVLQYILIAEKEFSYE